MDVRLTHPTLCSLSLPFAYMYLHSVAQKLSMEDSWLEQPKRYLGYLLSIHVDHLSRCRGPGNGHCAMQVECHSGDGGALEAMRQTGNVWIDGLLACCHLLVTTRPKGVARSRLLDTPRIQLWPRSCQLERDQPCGWFSFAQRGPIETRVLYGGPRPPRTRR